MELVKSAVLTLGNSSQMQADVSQKEELGKEKVNGFFQLGHFPTPVRFCLYLSPYPEMSWGGDRQTDVWPPEQDLILEGEYVCVLGGGGGEGGF